MLLLADGNGRTYLPDGTPIPPAGLSADPTGSWMCRWLSDAVGCMLKTQLDPEKSGGDQLECIVWEEPKLALEGKRAYYSSVVPRTPSEDTTFDEAKADHELAQLLKQNMLVRAEDCHLY